MSQVGGVGGAGQTPQSEGPTGKAGNFKMPTAAWPDEIKTQRELIENILAKLKKSPPEKLTDGDLNALYNADKVLNKYWNDHPDMDGNLRGQLGQACGALQNALDFIGQSPSLDKVNLFQLRQRLEAVDVKLGKQS